MLFNTKTFYMSISLAVNLGYPVESLCSFLRNIHLKHVKRYAHVLKSSLNTHVKDYCEGVNIVELARSINYPPCMVARALIEIVAKFPSSSNKRKFLSEALRDPIGKLGQIDSMTFSHHNLKVVDPFSGKEIKTNNTNRLAIEVLDAINSDTLYGPKYDKERNVIGQEHEIMLEQALISMSK